jgi:hypothetical protein
LHGELPGFLAAAVVDARSDAVLGALSRDPRLDAARAARLDADFARVRDDAPPGTRFEEALFSFTDQLHLLRVLAGGRLLLLIAERSGATSEARLRHALVRHLDSFASGRP